MESSRLIPTLAVTRLSLVMTSSTLLFMSVSKRRSRLVMIPTNFLPLTIGTPEMPNFSITARTSWTLRSGSMVTGSTIIPLSDFLTFSTSVACRAILIFLWMIPTPPWRAMLMAVWYSVTVSMAALTMGIFS